TDLDGTLIRPHDIEVFTAPAEHASHAKIDKVLHLGFEVRLELTIVGDGQVAVQIDRAKADELDLVDGQDVWVRPRERTTAFAA
ncbi:MAG: sulfate/thiosulfate transport system ATP-binding protein, partial [Thermoleophilaceae bacterium]|nr:sulfate/thiosulfate transport system ATP-binding protein [Thermoleophilaceae bacterium]